MTTYPKLFSLLSVFSSFFLGRCGDPFLFQQKKYAVEEIEGLAEQSARLPCNMTIAQNDNVFLVLWFKEGLTTPIYSYDVREMLSGEPKHWWDSDVLEDRAFFNAHSNPPHLFIRRLVIADSGLYKCRVDFQKEATRNSRVNLTVIVPPRQVILVDQVKGGEIRGSVGPYKEGSALRLFCISHGGFPRPTVKWFIEETVIDEVPEKLDDDVIRNDLVIENIERSHAGKRLTCRVTNNNLFPPLSSSAIIEMILPPLDAKITASKEPYSAGRVYDFICSSRGSQPTPTFTWWLGDKELLTAVTNSSTSNITTSTLRIKIHPSFNKKTLNCNVYNNQFEYVTLQDSINLTVYYIPFVSANFGKNLDASNIKEHDDAYFECSITSNPSVYKVSWQHSGVEIAHDVTKGVIISNQSLVLRNISRLHSGKYTCHASNVEGDGISPPLYFNVKYAPVCHNTNETVYGVSKMEDAFIACQVDAEPQVTSFKWYFNNTAESLSVPEGRYTMGLGGRSVVTYTPMSEMDYGTLLCYAQNSVGWQQEPCLFHIIPATLPEAATNCSIYNLSANSLSIRCSPGFDGGLKQIFILEVYSSAPHKLHVNITSGNASFDVDGLESDSEFQLIVYSANSKGRSGITRLVGITHKLPIKQLETRLGDGSNAKALESSEQLQMATVVGIAVAGAVIAVLIFAVVTIYIKRQGCRCTTNNSSVISSQSESENIDQIKSYSPRENVQSIRSGLTEPDSMLQLSCLEIHSQQCLSDCRLDVAAGTKNVRHSGRVSSFSNPSGFVGGSILEPPQMFASSSHFMRESSSTAPKDVRNLAHSSPSCVELQPAPLRCRESSAMFDGSFPAFFQEDNIEKNKNKM